MWAWRMSRPAGINGVSPILQLVRASAVVLEPVGGPRLDASRRSDRRSRSPHWTFHDKTHQLPRADYRFDRSRADRLESAGGLGGARVSRGLHGAARRSCRRRLSFADFLRGLPQQASVQYGRATSGRRGSMSLFFQRLAKSARLTLNLGVRYELIWPFVEHSGNMVTSDVPGSPPRSRGLPSTRAVQRTFPQGAEPDTKNIAPRVGPRGASCPAHPRGGYGISFNSVVPNSHARLTVQRVLGQQHRIGTPRCPALETLYTRDRVANTSG